MVYCGVTGLVYNERREQTS